MAAPLTEFTTVNTIQIPDGRRFDKLKILSVAPLLSQAIQFTHDNDSVSSLFDIA